MIYPERRNAISALHKGKKIVECGDITTIDDAVVEDFTDIDAKLVEMEAEYDAQEYARNRQAEYPSVQELVVALYDESDKEALVSKRAAVKLKYPKP